MSTTVTEAIRKSERAERILNEAVLMFVRITQVLNVRDDLNDKIKHTSFYNTKDEAKAATFDLVRPANVGYLWMTITTDTLKDDGSVERVNENFMWTRAKQWVRKETKAYQISAADAAKSSNDSDGNVNPEANLPESDNNADF